MKEKVTKIISSILSTIIVLLSVFLLVKNIFFFEIIVVGTSMDSTLKEGEMGFAIKDNFLINIDREDIIIFQKEGREIIKRVIGVPSDHIKITQEGVYVNDTFIEEPYLKEGNEQYTFNGLNAYKNIILGEDDYFVLGDNRVNSYDSRYYGPIKKEQITGKLKVITAQGELKEDDQIENKKIIPFRFF